MAELRVLVEVIASFKRQLRARGVDPARLPQSRDAAQRTAFLQLALELVEAGLPIDQAVERVNAAAKRLL